MVSGLRIDDGCEPMKCPYYIEKENGDEFCSYPPREQSYDKCKYPKSHYCDRIKECE